MPEQSMPSIQIDVEKLTVAAQVELESLTGARSLLNWLDRYAAYDREAVLRLPLGDLKALGETIGEQLSAALSPNP